MPKSQTTNERMRRESRAQLLAAAAELFATQGFFNTRTTDIARAARMSQGSLYWYFSSKEALLKAILTDGFSAYEQALAEAAAMPGTGGQRLDALIARSLGLFAELEHFFSILLSLLGHGGQPLLRELGFDMEAIGRGYHQHLLPVLLQAQQEGSIAHADPHWQAVCFFSFFNGLLLTYRDLFPQFPPQAVRAAVYGLLGACQDMEGEG
jgi:AcrR family transcriptional regulator